MKIFKLSGIVIKVNFLLPLAFILYWGLGFLLEIFIVFLLTLIHEIAHTVAARHFGIEVMEIELFPLGGVVRLKESYIIKSREEIIISLAGPLVNIFLALIAFFLLYFKIVNDFFFNFFLISNIIIGVFNLIPVFPLDGGRVIRAVLSDKLGSHRATRITIGIGKVVSILLMIAGSYLTYLSLSYIYIVFLSVFIFYQAREEKKMSIFILIREILYRREKLMDQGIMDSKHLTVIDSVDLKTVFKSFSSGKYHYVNVINNRGELVGSLMESQIIDGISRFGGQLSLAAYLDMTMEKESQ